MPDSAVLSSDESEVAVFLGTTNRILVRGEETGGFVSAVEVTVAPGAGSPVHTNTREALTWYVVDGALTFQRDAGTVEVAAGELIHLPKGDTHAFLNRADRPTRALMICTPGGLEGFLAELGSTLPAEVPAGPPPAEALRAIGEAGERYGVRIS